MSFWAKGWMGDWSGVEGIPLRDGSCCKIGWIIWKFPNRPHPPLIFGKLYCTFFSENVRKKALFKGPQSAKLLRKFIWFGSMTRPWDYYDYWLLEHLRVTNKQYLVSKQLQWALHPGSCWELGLVEQPRWVGNGWQGGHHSWNGVRQRQRRWSFSL